MNNLTEILNLLLYFFLYSIIGWILESLYKSMLEKKAINSGFLHGPYCPIYGFGAVIMLIFLKRFESNLFLLFIMGFVILSIWEYFVGYMLEKVYQTKYWDYSNSKFNLKGRICLLNSCYWGVLGVIFIKLIHPIIEKIIEGIDMEWIISFDIIFFLVFTIDFIVSTVKVKGIDQKLEELKIITETMKEKLEELKNAKTEELKNEEFIKDLKEAFEELRLKEDKLKIILYKQSTRLKKAFPTIQSDKINEILKKEIDLKTLKNRIHKRGKESIK